MLAPLALAACGFRPAYAPGQTGSKLRNHVLVDAPTDQNSYILTRELEERLGRGAGATYALGLSVLTSERQLALNQEGDIGRFHLLGRVDYNLRDINTGQVITSDYIENFVGFSATGTTVVTLAGKRDATARLMNIMADQVVNRLLAAELPE